MRSSQEPTSATADHIATAAPISPCPSPQATLAASVATIPRLRRHRASAETDVFWCTASSITIELA